jgi:hypothetical protein
MSVTTAPSTAVSHETMEHVLGTGDLSRLSTQQRVEYYAKVCSAIGVNPLTRPFRFMQFQGNTVLYATRDLTDQLRSLRKISLSIVDKRIDGDLYIVTARASTAEGRQDEDMGAVTLGQLRGEQRANALMKALTKAKRRVTLSICGLGFLDESEVETLSGAVTYDHDAPPAESTPSAREAINAAVPLEPKQRAGRQTISEWLEAMELALKDAGDNRVQVDRILFDARSMQIAQTLRNGALQRYNQMKAAAIQRANPTPPPDEEVPEDDADADTWPGPDVRTPLPA